MLAPAGSTIFYVEIFVPFQVQISLEIAHRNDMPDLRTDPKGTGLEAPDAIAGSCIAGDLLIRVSYHTDLPLCGVERGLQSFCAGHTDQGSFAPQASRNDERWPPASCNAPRSK
jgi:hypothetical protein